MNHTRPTITEESVSGASRAFIASVKELTPPVLDADQENRRIMARCIAETRTRLDARKIAPVIDSEIQNQYLAARSKV